ncbi:MAG TPA: hypothetical protein VFY44_12035 [Thermoleophilaceae bacterium]|nr:hypothetical protein [Thermoleophilaceae bacterium]
MLPRPLPNRSQALKTCALAATAALASTLLLIAATLAPAPAAALPFLVAVCIGFPLAAAWELPPAMRALRAVSDMRRSLDELPETEHPLGY